MILSTDDTRACPVSANLSMRRMSATLMMLNHFRLDKIAEKKNASLEVHEAHPVIT